MPSSAGPAELLSDLAAALAAIGARWYVFGAQAALVWGRPRLTTDVDVTIKCPASTDHLVRTLDASGFSLRIDATEAFIRTTRVVPLEHWASGLALDVVLAGPGLEDLFLERAVPVDVAGTVVPFISPAERCCRRRTRARAGPRHRRDRRRVPFAIRRRRVVVAGPMAADLVPGTRWALNLSSPVRFTPAFIPQHHTMRSTPDGLASGAMVGAYRIERLLGRGGMGAVYLAYDTTLHRQVALKTLAAPAGGEERCGVEPAARYRSIVT